MTEPPIVSALEHYERCIDEGIDPCKGNPQLQRYMVGWGGARFFELLGDLNGKAVLEIGVGTGRPARRALTRGCSSFTGVDVSPKTISRARHNLNGFVNGSISAAAASSSIRQRPKICMVADETPQLAADGYCVLISGHGHKLALPDHLPGLKIQDPRTP